MTTQGNPSVALVSRTTRQLPGWGTALAGSLLFAMPLSASAAMLLSQVGYSLMAKSEAGSEEILSDVVPLGGDIGVTVNDGGSTASAFYYSALPGEFAMISLGAFTTWPAGIPNVSSPGANNHASAAVTVQDNFIVQKPLTGPGSGPGEYRVDLSFTIGLSGWLTQTNGTARWLAEARLSADAYRDHNFSIVQPSISVDAFDTNPYAIPNPSLPLTLTSAIDYGADTSRFRYGVPIDLMWEVRVLADSYNYLVHSNTAAAGSASADLLGTAVWVGITARDELGQVIEDLTITSASGLNWANPPAPVPLPASAWLLMTALGAVGLRASRRTSRAARVRAAA